MEDFEKFGISVPKILLPKTDLKAWSVIACDQYTQDREYWEKVSQIAKGKPSSLHIILPEVYLNDSNRTERIENIRKTMKDYLRDDIFADEKQAFIYIERKTAYGRTRKGLVAAIDLESYEWKPFSTALIRATEATIIDRIPPRMEIRRGAPIETPHIMLLVNDTNCVLVESCGESLKSNGKQPVYNTDLMADSGHITGWTVESESELSSVKNALNKLYEQNKCNDGSVFMFAVGDGNHSLATAKAVWDELKENNGGKKNDDGSISIPAGFENHNARFALIEIVNIYDKGLTFEPIHRILFNIQGKTLIEYVAKKLNGKIIDCANAEEIERNVLSSKANFGFVWKDTKTAKTVYKCVETNITDLAVSHLQPILDQYLNENANESEIDYIHGSDEVFRLGEKDNTVSILLPPIAKDSFFATIVRNGPLPRKSFSMGEASEKRFYMECRKLF
ncbi:MAG: DUF1015 domain-containing protein [Treponema sp.]|nr:DUF1015 domain-containing protein [Treponema sp.]